MSAARLERLALDAGFELVGFARAEPIPPQALVQWLEAGFAADLDWMKARVEERLDVTKLLPGARTVVALACNYHRTDAPGPIARYARGRDYHTTMRHRLRTLRRTLRETYPGVNDYGSVDAAPVMEKVWAARAGLGYVGKNGCFITERFGSWVVLAAMILDAPVDAYANGPTEDRCGRCNLCVTACPTSAIEPGARIDAERCVAYQTIEQQGAVPEHLREGLAGMVFGCDLCQQVCPLNDAPLPAGDRFAPRAVADASVLELAAMSRAQYDAWVPGTALACAQYRGLRRNAAYALGAARVAGARPVLEHLSRDEDETVREAAAWALERLR
ncbi:MAG: tRNA epoxyqueuosine(34) reductase QueG [Archangiaceae bacterium]|nr:tRNA epoxyqueuosine(34) reductase QueG [Archangiaceae bacterium]